MPTPFQKKAADSVALSWAPRPYVSVILIGVVLAGCAAGPSFKKPTPESPAGWSWHGGDTSLQDPDMRANQAPVPERWWEEFDDQTLNALQVRAAAANLDLRTAVLHFAQSRAQRRIVAAQRSPQVDAEASGNRRRESEHDATSRLIGAIDPKESGQLEQLLSAPYNLYQAGFDASWELDLWGRVRRSLESADADVAASAATLDGVRIGIEAEVARNYFDLRGIQRQVQLAREDVAAAETYLGLVQARADGGVITDLDATRQRALLADLRAHLPQLLDQEAQSINQLSLLLGERPGSLQDELASREAGSAHMLPNLGLGLPSELARRRPDIRQAEAQLHSATASIGVAVADLYPRITLTGNFGIEAIDVSNLSAWSSRRWAVGPSLDVPIFDMGRRRSVVTLRKLQQQEAAVLYQRTVLAAWHEVDTTLSGYASERQRNERLAEREKLSRHAFDLARALCQGGLTSFLEELNAQRSMLSAQRDFADSNSLLAIRLIAIYKALGGGLVGDEPAPQLAR
ncbi:MAG: efflux transporter outer membrane subunit [Steroidobacteraceae bacterium]